MVRTPSLSAICGVLALCSLFARGASATSFTASGQLPTDTAVVQYNLAITTPGATNFYTTSYAGGLNADGTTTAGGGFDPVLTLYSSTGAFIATGGGASTCGGSTNADSVTGLCNDAYFTESLDTGNYTLAITEFPFYPNGDLSSGFFSSIDPTAISDACGSSTPFLESDVAPCVARNGNYTVNASSVTSTVTPEPSTLLLLAGPLAGLIYSNRRRLA